MEPGLSHFKSLPANLLYYQSSPARWLIQPFFFLHLSGSSKVGLECVTYNLSCFLMISPFPVLWRLFLLSGVCWFSAHPYWYLWVGLGGTNNNNPFFCHPVPESTEPLQVSPCGVSFLCHLQHGEVESNIWPLGQLTFKRSRKEFSWLCHLFFPKLQIS